MALSYDEFVKKLNSKELTSVPVSCLLLSPGNPLRTQAKGFSKSDSIETNFLNLLVGKHFQRKLKEEIRKNTIEYVCEVCHGTGVLTAFDGASRKEFTQALSDLLTITAVPKIFSSINRIFGISSTGKFQLELYDLIGRKFFTSAKALADRKKKNKKRFTQQEKPDKIAEIEQFLLNNFGNFNDLASFIQPCYACNAQGYYDIGHVFDFGKQVDMMLYIYRKYILQGNGDWEKRWEQEVPVDILMTRFFQLKVQPELPNRVSNIGSFTKAQALAISKYKTNRDSIYTDLIQSVKEELHIQFDKIRLEDATTNVDTSKASFLEVYKFFERMSSTARVSTGTLKKAIQKQKLSITQHYNKMKAVYNTTSMKDTPFPEAGMVIEGPSSGERLGSRVTGNSRSILFVYAAMYIPSSLHGGKGGAEVAWGKGQTVRSIIESSFLNLT